MATTLTATFYRGDHVEITFDIEGAGSIAAWTFDFGIWINPSTVDPDGSERAIIYKTLADDIEIVDADERTVMVTLDAETTAELKEGAYHARFRRTNANSEAVLSAISLKVKW